MINESIVFILGAGASRPYGYPTGIELREQICSSFVSDSRAYFEKERRIRTPIELKLGPAEDFIEKFRKSSISSIDLFLARNPEFMIMGKWAIIFRILAAESRSRFREDMEDPSQDWYSHLFWKLTDELVKKEDYIRFCENNVSFITFNYDRSLEHFLYESLMNSFNGISAEEIKKQFTQLRIIHVFRQVVGLDWQDIYGKIEYRRDISLINVPNLIKNLRIIYEENENPELDEAQEIIGRSQHICFLGFGYAKENLELLNIPGLLKNSQNIYGTALGLTHKEIKDIKNIFPNQERTHIEDLDCLKLLRQYL